MVRFTIVSAAAMLASTAAFAADQFYPAPAQPAYEPVFTPYIWSGPYVGIQGGGGWGETDTDFLTVTPSTGTTSYDLDGGLLGLQVGTRWQHDMLVLGFQGDASWASFDGGAASASGALESMETNYLLSATARAGIAYDNILPYVLGGFSVVDYDYTLTNAAGTASETHGDADFGGTLGFGAEVALTDQISVFGEYRHYWFNGDAISFAGPGAVPAQTVTPDLGLDTATVGVNWRF